MMMDGSLFCATLRTVYVKISKSVFSFLRMLTECHCPHLPVAADRRLCVCAAAIRPARRARSSKHAADRRTD